MFQYNIAAVGRSTCPMKFLSFPVPCTTQSPDLVDLWNAAGPEQTFRLFPFATNAPIEMLPNTNGPCADPFVWFDSVVGMCVRFILHNTCSIQFILSTDITSSARHQTSRCILFMESCLPRRCSYSRLNAASILICLSRNYPLLSLMLWCCREVLYQARIPLGLLPPICGHQKLRLSLE